MLAIEDQLAIERLYAAYNQFIDANRVDEWVALFAPDGAYVSTATYTGRVELAAFARKRAELEPTLPYRDAQHWNSSILLDQDGETVRGSCYLARFAVNRSSGAKEMVTLGRYQDEFVRHEGQWVFARREAIPA